MRRALVAALLVVVLAGCTGGKPSAPAPSSGLGQDVAVQVSDTTGAIRGVVVDAAIRPLANATVSLLGGSGPQVARTAASGGFGFSNLPAGTYFLKVSKNGYLATQASADVVAGVREPSVVKIQLVLDTAHIAYASGQEQDGYIVCTTSVVAVCGAPNIVSTVLLCPAFNVCLGNVTDDRFGLNFFYDANATVIQSEMFWTSTQPVTTQLDLEMENLGNCTAAGDSYIKDVAGESPIYNRLDAKDVQAGSIGGNCPIWHSVFSGHFAGTPAGVTVQQKFSIFSHSFYNYAPPDGWRFSTSGEVPPPPA